MTYEELEPIARSDFQIEMASGDTYRMCTALVRAALYDSDRPWLEDLLATYLRHPEVAVRTVAATCTGHVARLHGEIDLERLVPLLRALESSEETLGAAQDALSDIDVFIGRR